MLLPMPTSLLRMLKHTPMCQDLPVFLFLGSLRIMLTQLPHLFRRLLAVAKKMNQVVIPAAEAFYHGLNHGEVLSTFSPKNTTNYSSRSKRLRKRLPFNVLIIVLCNCINNCKDCLRQKIPITSQWTIQPQNLPGVECINLIARLHVIPTIVPSPKLSGIKRFYLSPSPTSFRPLLPRELLFPFKFPVATIPFPTFPADLSGTANSTKRITGKTGGFCPPQA